MARARGRCTASRSAARVPHIVEPGRDGGAGPPTPRAERASPCARRRSGAPCRGAGASPCRRAAESSHKILRGDDPITAFGLLTHGATMRERVKRICRNVNDGLDLILFMNAVDPHIDMSFFYATGITDGLFEGCGAWLAPDGGLKITTSALEEEAAKKSGLPLEVFRTRDENAKLIKKNLKGHRKIGVNASELTYATFQRLQKLAPPSVRFVDISSAVTKTPLGEGAQEVRPIPPARPISPPAVRGTLPVHPAGVPESEVPPDSVY